MLGEGPMSALISDRTGEIKAIPVRVSLLILLMSQEYVCSLLLTTDTTHERHAYGEHGSEESPRVPVSRRKLIRITTPGLVCTIIVNTMLRTVIVFGACATTTTKGS